MSGGLSEGGVRGVPVRDVHAANAGLGVQELIVVLPAGRRVVYRDGFVAPRGGVNIKGRNAGFSEISNRKAGRSIVPPEGHVCCPDVLRDVTVVVVQVYEVDGIAYGIVVGENLRRGGGVDTHILFVEARRAGYTAWVERGVRWAYAAPLAVAKGDWARDGVSRDLGEVRLSSDVEVLVERETRRYPDTVVVALPIVAAWAFVGDICGCGRIVGHPLRESWLVDAEKLRAEVEPVVAVGCVDVGWSGLEAVGG